MSFIDEKCMVFTPEDENKFEYTAVSSEEVFRLYTSCNVDRPSSVWIKLYHRAWAGGQKAAVVPSLFTKDSEICDCILGSIAIVSPMAENPCTQFQLIPCSVIEFQ